MHPDIQERKETEGTDQHPHEDTMRDQIIRKGKLILYNGTLNPQLDESVVTLQRYSCFGANMFPNKHADLQLAAGITSPHPGDGKSVVAANLATFLALDTQDETVLIDLNANGPKAHQIFGVPAAPGILDSLRGDTITLSRTAIKGLWVLPLGTSTLSTMTFDRVVELRETISTLKRQFRFILIDLPSVLHGSFPGMISSHLDGYFVVVSAGKTTKTDIRQVMHLLNEQKVIGFMMNRVPKEMMA